MATTMRAPRERGAHAPSWGALIATGLVSRWFRWMSRVSTIVGFTLNATLYGTIFAIGLYLQWHRGYSAFGTGLAFLPFCVALNKNAEASRIEARLEALKAETRLKLSDAEQRADL